MLLEAGTDSPGRQFLVSEYRASILSNLVAMVLTLSGPRLWILIKALLLWSYEAYRKRSSHGVARMVARIPLILQSSFSNAASHHTLESLPQNQHELTACYSRSPDHPLDHAMASTAGSRSELGAARGIIINTLNQIFSRRVKLVTSSATPSTCYEGIRTCLRRLSKRIHSSWENLLRQLTEVIASLSLSMLFSAIFVAESSGSVFSARIITDTIALVASKRCFLPYYSLKFDRKNNHYSYNAGYYDAGYASIALRQAASYSQNCYNADRGKDGCNYFIINLPRITRY